MRAFLKEAISTAYTVAERRFVDRYGRRRLFLLVAKVDEQLEELTRMVLHQQHAALNLAAKLDEIRGLLLISIPKVVRMMRLADIIEQKQRFKPAARSRVDAVAHATCFMEAVA